MSTRGSKIISTRFVFTRKRDELGNVIRHKARRVVRGFFQGDVEQTFAPVVEFTTIRTCIAVAVMKGYIIQQIDVRIVFFIVRLTAIFTSQHHMVWISVELIKF